MERTRKTMHSKALLCLLMLLVPGIMLAQNRSSLEIKLAPTSVVREKTLQFSVTIENTGSQSFSLNPLPKASVTRVGPSTKGFKFTEFVAFIRFPKDSAYMKLDTLGPGKRIAFEVDLHCLSWDPAISSFTVGSELRNILAAGEYQLKIEMREEEDGDDYPITRYFPSNTVKFRYQ